MGKEDKSRHETN